jgi:hypothetical protein
VGCSSTITERRHEGGAADPAAGILLGWISLPGVSGPEADDRGALFMVAGATTVMGGLGPQRSVHSGRVHLKVSELTTEGLPVRYSELPTVPR